MFDPRIIIGTFLLLSIFPLNAEMITKSFTTLIKKRHKMKRSIHEKHKDDFFLNGMKNKKNHNKNRRLAKTTNKKTN